ncbi:hypothetical protein LJ707_17090 [Mucilaginibacter sp. UR6-1]|nr:hypothetical protein [Mucilaginibacter sp. UR6-1]MCC8410661.1 hypothetical protein [Mucilaginibacter sp. UR6-1]
MKEREHTENLNADELMFFHSLRTDLNQLQMQPRLQTIHRILDYSKSIK